MRATHIRYAFFAGIALASTLPVPALAGQSSAVVPNAAENTAASSSFLGPLANSQRTYQLLIHESQLSAIVGHNIVGLSWRLPPAATSDWPAAPVEYSDYDIYLSGSVAPADRSLTFVENVVGPQQQVRSGPLSIATDVYASGQSPNDFGPVIQTQEWHYTGGHLLIEIRHQGFTGTSRSVDAAGTASAGYGSLFSAAWTGNYTGTSGSQGNFAVVRLSVEDAGGPAGDVILSNLPEDNDDDASLGIDDQTWQALRFTMPSDAGAIAGSLSLRLGGYEGGALVQLRDAGPELHVPGSNILLGFSDGEVRGGGGIGEVLFSPNTTYHLQPDTSYWLVVAGSNGQAFDWHGSDPGIVPSGLAEFDLYSGTNNGSDWQLSEVYNSLRFSFGDDVIFANGFEDD